MNEKKIIAIVGATGATAGGLARAILDDPDGPFSVRAITRTPDSPQAQALAARGATVVGADSDELDSLIAAFDGAYGAFCMTTFWDHLSGERETARAANQAWAAQAVGVQHTIWSTLEDTRRWYPLNDQRMPTVLGHYKVPPFDAKADGDVHFTSPTTFLLTPTHWDAFVFGLGVPQPGPDGVRTIAIPMGETLLPGIAAEDIGRSAHGIFADPDRWIGKTVGIAGEQVSCEHIAAGLSEVFGEPVRYSPLPAEVFRALPFPGVDIAANMFQFIAEVDDYRTSRDVAVTRTLNPDVLGFDAWVAQVTPLVAGQTTGRA